DHRRSARRRHDRLGARAVAMVPDDARRHVAREGPNARLTTKGAHMPDVQQIRLDPDPLEPYALSQGFRVGDLVIVSGQGAVAQQGHIVAARPAIDEQGHIVGAGDFDAQAEQTFRNLARVLEAGGSSLERIVKVTIFLTDMANFPQIVALRRRWFSPTYPPDTI